MPSELKLVILSKESASSAKFSPGKLDLFIQVERSLLTR